MGGLWRINGAVAQHLWWVFGKYGEKRPKYGELAAKPRQNNILDFNQLQYNFTMAPIFREDFAKYGELAPLNAASIADGAKNMENFRRNTEN